MNTRIPAWRTLRVWTLAAVTLGPPPAQAAEPADLLLLNGRVYTLSWGSRISKGRPPRMRPSPPRASDRTPRRSRSRAGESCSWDRPREPRRTAGPRRVCSICGSATVLPGLVDSHTHIAELGEAASRVDLVDVKTEAEAVERVAERARSIPKGQWIVGRGLGRGGVGQPLSRPAPPEREGARPSRLPGEPPRLRGLGQPPRPGARRHHQRHDGARGRRDPQGCGRPARPGSS